MTTVKKIYDFLDDLAPFSLQMDFDNAGRLVGREQTEVTRCMVSLDITPPVARQAAEAGIQLVVSHHPVIFFPAKTVTEKTTAGETVLILAENGISAICSHTCLDRVTGGVNNVLAEILELKETDFLRVEGEHEQLGTYGIGRFGTLIEKTDIESFCKFIKKALNCNGVRYASCGKPVKKVAVGGGACHDYMYDAMDKGCDTFVTSDLRYNDFLDARDLGINIIDAGHFPTENPIIPVLKAKLETTFPEVEFILAHAGEVIQYV